MKTSKQVSKFIFYLDDDLDDLIFFQSIAENMNHRVATFTDGYDMLQSLALHWKDVDIIFLDIHMPILNGEEILNLIRKSENYNNIPIVMISGAYPQKLARHFLRVGANFLMKKTGVTDLRAALGEVLAIDFKTFHAFPF